MKVKIGPYVDWYGPYQLADAIGKFMSWSDDECFAFGERLSSIKWLDKFMSRLHARKRRRVEIHLDGHDTWNADHTLALIIVPMLKKFKDEISSIEDFDERGVIAWNWILDQMIEAFEFTLILNDGSFYEYNANIQREMSLRAERGRHLFAKYYDHLWS